MKDIGWTRSNNFSAARFLFALFALLVFSFHAPAVRAEITGAWTINGSTSASTTVLGITITQTGSGGPVDGTTANYANDTLTTTTS